MPFLRMYSKTPVAITPIFSTIAVDLALRVRGRFVVDRLLGKKRRESEDPALWHGDLLVGMDWCRRTWFGMGSAAEPGSGQFDRNRSKGEMNHEYDQMYDNGRSF